MKNRRYRGNDVFVGFNVFLFMIMCRVVYYDRLVKYRGPGNIHEFFIYACAILITICAIWWFVRRLPFPAWLLAIIQIGILMHFAGAFVPIDGGRLYDVSVFGIRYDKYVHATNAFAGAALASHLLRLTQSSSPLLPIIVVMSVLGGGAVVEIVEYLVSITVVSNGVGTYDNNMQDLIANLFGALAFQLLSSMNPLGYVMASGRRMGFAKAGL